MDDNYFLFFPTLVLKTENILCKEENDLIYNHIISNQKNVLGEGEKHWHSKEKSPINSFNSNYSHPIFENLLSIVDIKIRLYAAQIKLQDWRLNNNSWWWNIYSKDNYQEFHSHVPYYISAVYFCKTPKGSSPLIFKHPNFNHYLPVYGKNEYNTDCETIQPLERSLVVFPSTLIHCVPPGKNIDPRITVSFNYG